MKQKSKQINTINVPIEFSYQVAENFYAGEYPFSRTVSACA